MTRVTQGPYLSRSATQRLRELLRRLPLECELWDRDRLLRLRDFDDPLRDVLRCDRDRLLFDEDLLGTFAPSLRASESPMAMACFRLVTFLPLRPLFSLPRFISCISSFTFWPARGLYFLPPDERCEDELLFVAMSVLPSTYWEATPNHQVARSGHRVARRGCLGRCVTRLARRSRRRQNVFDVHPLRRIIARVAGHTVGVALATVARVA